MNPDWIALSAALIAGLLGSVHCAGMCGGIAVGLSAAAPKNQALGATLCLNLGRIFGYAVAGGLAGGLGNCVVWVFREPGLQQILRAGVGVVLLLAALRLLDGRGRLALLQRAGAILWQRLAPLHRRLLPADTAWRQLAAGLLWGWLPCGLSSTLLAAAWFTLSPWHGALLMTAFGAGTLLTLVPLTFGGVRLNWSQQHPQARRCAAAVLAGSGLLTIAAPWLAGLPALHNALRGLGCLSAG